MQENTRIIGLTLKVPDELKAVRHRRLHGIGTVPRHEPGTLKMALVTFTFFARDSIFLLKEKF